MNMKADEMMTSTVSTTASYIKTTAIINTLSVRSDVRRPVTINVYPTGKNDT